MEYKRYLHGQIHLYMRYYFLILAIGLLSFSSQAQTAALGAKLQDSASKAPLVGATITLSSNSNGSLKGAISNAEGGFFITDLADGTYTLKVTYLGYHDYIRTVKIPGNPFPGIIYMAANTNTIQGVDIKQEYAIGQTKGDTMEFNSQAFKTAQNANAKDLVEKIPGVQNDGGTIKAEGETVQQILVDGKPFFGQDPNAALGTLPAEVVDKIQVFDDQSEQSKASGVDDGTRVKTINIVTKINMRYGEFGKVYAGAGTDGRYSTGANVNKFRGDQRISILGQYNNINQQNFSTADLLGVVADNSEGGHRRGPSFMRGFSASSDASDFMVNPRNGIINTLAGGLNYQDSWSDKWSASGSYFFNRAESDAITNTKQLYFLSDNNGQTYTSRDSAHGVNTNHRLNAKLVYKMSEKSSFFILPSFTIQQNKGDQLNLSTVLQDSSLQSKTYNLFNSNLTALNWNNEVMFRHNFAKKGRSVFSNVKVGQNTTEGESGMEYTLPYDDPYVVHYQDANIKQVGLDLGGSLMYSEPIGDKGLSMYTNYEISNTQNTSDQLSYDVVDEQNPLLINNLSAIYTNDWLSQALSLGIRKFDRKFGYAVNLKAQSSRLLNTQELPDSISVDKPFRNILAFAMLRAQLSKNGNLFVMYRSYTNAPSASQLQQNVDNSNPIQLKIGNPNLNQQYTNYIRVRYKSSNPAKSTVFFTGLRANFSNNYIGNSTYTASVKEIVDGVVLEPLSQLSKPVNLNKYADISTMIDYGFPVKALKSNLNISGSQRWTNTPAMVNNELTSTISSNYSLALVLSSNISDKLDFTVSSTSNYNEVNNGLNENLNNRYYVQQSRIKLDWIMLKGITFRSQFEYQEYFGLSNSLDNTVLLWTAGIGKQLFKDKKGEIQLSVFDILGQNNQISQQFYDSYYQESTSNVLTRYAMLSFSYNFSKFREKKVKGGDEPTVK